MLLSLFNFYSYQLIINFTLCEIQIQLYKISEKLQL
jgi:hypothetical protein